MHKNTGFLSRKLVMDFITTSSYSIYLNLPTYIPFDRFTWDDTTGIFHSAARTAPRGSGRRGTWTTTNGSTPGINPSSVKAAARPSHPPRPCASTLRRLQSAGNMRRTCRDLTANLNHLTKQRMNSIWLTVLFWWDHSQLCIYIYHLTSNCLIFNL